MAGSGRGGRLDMASNGRVYLSNSYVQDNSAISQTAPPAGMGFGNPGTSQYPDTPRRTHNPARQPEELHISSDGGGTMNPQSSAHIPRHHSYHASQDAGAAPGISVHQATPQGTHHTSGLSAGTLPGALRPGVSSANTAPGSVPTLPQISTQTQQYASSSRSSTASHSHSYSRSSPAGFDQKYLPYNSTPESSKYPSTPNHRYGSSHTPHGSSAYSPLGLSDIRPDSSMDGPMSANPYSSDANSSFSTNSNYMAPWPVYAFDWCKWPVQSQNSGDAAGKMAIGSFVEDGHNFIQILDTHATLEEDDMSDDAPQYGLEFVKTAEATHSYPVTRILWEPASSQKQSTDLLATSGDHLRLWSLPSQPAYNHSNSISRSSTGCQLAPQKLTPLALLSNSKSPEHTAPLTSLDWNNVSPSLIITSSIDTTCTIWDIPTLTAKTQLIAHDKEVFDVRFCANSVDVFVSCGADGSVRMFDLRSLEHSTIIYEPSEKNDKSSSSEGNLSPTLAQQTMSYAPPLLRLAASPHDAHLLATFSQDSNSIRILDVRQPGQALLELKGHSAAINCIEWSPSRRGTLASGGDDSLVLIWDLLSQGSLGTVNGAHGQQITSAATPSERAPIASWMCDYEVGNISWAPQSGLQGQGNDWLGVSGGRGIWGVCM
ncbi:MAG: hypothetical protein LQ350_003949 [Teloschistes chrysophthalmus]|nr:MAG: hypothetical protein LQ350_003949 [Niorma chrysophthalma]